MKYEKNRKILGMDELTIIKMLKLFALPIITVILIIVIVIADHTKKDNVETTASMTSSSIVSESTSDGDSPEESTSVVPDNNVYIQDFANYGLQKDSIPEIGELVSRYQEAKINADAKAMYAVFGRTDTDGLDQMQAKMNEEAGAYEAYEDTACYTTAGAEDNSYIVYISSNLKFKGIDTPAPMLTWAYITVDADGNYNMKEPGTLTEEEQRRVDDISVSEDVKVLDSQMRTKLAQAVVSDTKLAALYQMLSVGETTSEGTGESESNTTETETETEEESVEEASISIVETAAVQ